MENMSNIGCALDLVQEELITQIFPRNHRVQSDFEAAVEKSNYVDLEWSRHRLIEAIEDYKSVLVEMADDGEWREL